MVPLAQTRARGEPNNRVQHIVSTLVQLLRSSFSFCSRTKKNARLNQYEKLKIPTRLEPHFQFQLQGPLILIVCQGRIGWPLDINLGSVWGWPDYCNAFRARRVCAVTHRVWCLVLMIPTFLTLRGWWEQGGCKNYLFSAFHQKNASSTIEGYREYRNLTRAHLGRLHVCADG